MSHERTHNGIYTDLGILYAKHQPGRLMDHLVNALLQHSAPVDAKTALGNTPLMYAAAGGHHDCAKILIRAGAKVNSQDSTGETPLHKAVREGHVKVVNVLLEKGADKTLVNKAGMSPVAVADKSKRVEVVNALAAHSMDQKAMRWRLSSRTQTTGAPTHLTSQSSPEKSRPSNRGFIQPLEGARDGPSSAKEALENPGEMTGFGPCTASGMRAALQRLQALS